mmetsp:Transcript_29552/g.73786  ORF Transcript_29552/g.73786 Transcript_29552/m.73786 type:complete len:238 (-) Transcript_29552:1522-2235(-)
MGMSASLTMLITSLTRVVLPIPDSPSMTIAFPSPVVASASIFPQSITRSATRPTNPFLPTPSERDSHVGSSGTDSNELLASLSFSTFATFDVDVRRIPPAMLLLLRPKLSRSPSASPIPGSPITTLARELLCGSPSVLLPLFHPYPPSELSSRSSSPTTRVAPFENFKAWICPPALFLRTRSGAYAWTRFSLPFTLSDLAALNTRREMEFFMVVSHTRIPSLTLLAMKRAAVLTTSP